ncbi:hypothetical protein PFICI_11538 [Pestalotiopsis fici W106-1]|uniref:Protein MAK11 n=1 Tax=Pestalotiopsis fici (strain W106-1 / CGMCC3.15140) TaxID=1229662 RepID=W3WTJ0_PESFW|nr:uncharacterized protein PFICI_11538 [Pestalotiopsis fici W106-1]ETS76151.1 hypothetical protein PFICI_11538 [Pestalotiopsis fici W106-1]
MANKRKRAEPNNGTPKEESSVAVTKKAKKAEPFTLQIVAGSYDRVLHGITATITPGEDKADFADTFLFNAHTSAIRCIALSPPSAPEPGKGQKVMLATGSTDERINVFNISAHPPSQKSKDEQDLLSKIAPRKILENPKNREVGALLHHSSTVTKLAFPTKGKLISASEDSTIAVTRIRDMTVLSSIKVPIPKQMGRPSGDTAAMGGAPSGVNDFAVHPSMKLMISVSKGERSMRLWNLMTAKKAGVLNFGRDTLAAIGEGRHSSGEGRKIAWEPQAAEEFAVGFDRDILVFGMDGTPKCKVMPDSRTKIHEFSYVPLGSKEGDGSLLCVSTEDGRIMFFSTETNDLSEAADDKKTESLSVAQFVAQLGGKAAGIQGRIKDFAVLKPSDDSDELYFTCGSSDGKIRVFRTSIAELKKAKKVQDKEKKQVGKLLGAYETQNRITCLEAFVMIPRPDGAEDSEDEFEDVSSSDDDDEDDADED